MSIHCLEAGLRPASADRRPRFLFTGWAAAPLLVASLLASSQLHAADRTWDGEGGAPGNWMTGTNWVADTAPSANDLLIFAGATTLTTTNDFAANTEFDGIRFLSGAGAFVLNGNAINLGGNISNESSSGKTINLGLALLQDTTISTTNTLTIGGAISGGFSVTKMGLSTLTLNTANSFTGQLIVREGTVSLGASGTLAASELVLGGGTSGAPTFTATGAGGSIKTVNDVTLGYGRNGITSTRSSGSGNFTLSLGTLTRQTAGVVAFTVNANSVITATAVNTNGILGGWATHGNDWATVNGSNIEAYTAYTNIDSTTVAPTIASAAASNVRIINDVTNPQTSTATFNSSIITVADSSGYNVGDRVTGSWAATNGTGTLSIPFGATVTAVAPGQITISSPVTRSSGSPTGTEAAGVTVTGYLTKTDLALAASGVTDINTLQSTSLGHRTLTIGTGNTLRLGATGGIWKVPTDAATLTLVGGSITAGGADNTAGEIVFNVGGTTDSAQVITPGITVTSNIVDNGTGAVTVIKTGLQTLQLDGTNTYSGGTYILQGRIRSTVAGNLGAGDVTISNGAGILLAGAGNYSNDFFVSGTGISSRANAGDTTPGLHGAIILNNGANITGTMTLLGNTRVAASAYYGTSGNTGTISGQITGTGELEIGYNLNITSAGTVTISNVNNDWTGGLRISGGGSSGTRITTLTLGNSEVIPHGEGFGNLIFEKGNTSGGTVLNLAGFSETINGLNSTGTGGITLRNRTTAAATATLTVGAANASGVYSGLIENGNVAAILNFAKIGTGTQELAGSNTYTGTTTVSGGTLLVSGTMGATGSAISVNGGTFNYTNAATLGRSVTSNVGGRFLYNSTAAYTGTLTMNGGTVGGNGNLGATIVSGTGSVDPGNSAGIFTAAGFDPSSGLGAKFELTLANTAPTWNNAAASGNDVFRLTDGTSPFSSPLDSDNTIGIYLNVASIMDGDVFQGGFYTDRNADFLAEVSGANFEYYVFGDGGGSSAYQGTNYYTLAEFNNLLSFNVGTLQVASADFASGTVNNGYVLSLTANIIPEPSLFALLGLGLSPFVFARSRRRWG